MSDELAPLVPKAKMRKAGVILAALCAGIIAMVFADSEAGWGTRLGVTIPFGLLGVAFLALGFRSPARHPAIMALRNRRADVVWVYVLRHTVNGVHANSYLHIALVDGRSYALAIGKDEDEMLALVRRLVPRATAGYSPELAARFKRDPRSMLS